MLNREKASAIQLNQKLQQELVIFCQLHDFFFVVEIVWVDGLLSVGIFLRIFICILLRLSLFTEMERIAVNAAD